MVDESVSWQKGSYIEAETDFEEMDGQVEHLFLSWFRTNSQLHETEEEKKEKYQAIREQIAAGILQPNGLPVGYTPPKRPENNFQRKRRREEERKIRKQMKRQKNSNQPFRK